MARSRKSAQDPPERATLDQEQLVVELHPDAFLNEAALRRALAEATGHKPDEPFPWVLVRRSIDARRGKTRIVAVFEKRSSSPRGEAELAPSFLARRGTPPDQAARARITPYLATLRGEPNVLVVGAGPAGMFCAWQLARRGIRSRIVERGAAVAQRRRDIAALSQRGELNPESNYCFGEGGAGTFSDGKLYTRSDKRGPVRDILDALVDYGAPGDILVDARPHIGTNKLPRVITAMREDLMNAGVEFCFDTRIDELVVRDAAVVGAITSSGARFDARRVVVAPGHSAPDVLDWLTRAGVLLEFKPFAVGVRIEHPQAWIDQLQYHELAGHPVLGAASYRLVERTATGNAWSFCMCPGGYIVCAATHPQRQVVNGMSPSQRRGRFANSGFVTEVALKQIAAAGGDVSDPLAGLRYVEALEERAYRAGGGAFVAPAQALLDFVHDSNAHALPVSSYHRGVVTARLGDVLGADLTTPLRAALAQLERRMPGFVQEGAIAVGVETRTSSPVRIRRDPETLSSPSLAGLYPCGEGAGYAGGIVSAALDGVAVANALASSLE